MGLHGRSAAKKFFAAIALTATALVGSTAMASSALASPAGDLGAATNAARAASGLPALALNAQLTAVAQAWANQLAAAGTLSHNGALRSQVTGWSVLGENVGMGGNVPAIQAAFMASPGHRANILDPRYTQMGVGSATSIYPSCGCPVLWVVVDFRRPTSVPASAPARAAQPAPAKPAAVKPKIVTRPAPAPAVVRPATQAPPAPPAPPAPVPSADPSSQPSAVATASALTNGLAASARPSGAIDRNPVGRMLNFATVMSQLAG